MKGSRPGPPAPREDPCYRGGLDGASGPPRWRPTRFALLVAVGCSLVLWALLALVALLVWWLV